jgi:ribose-phosphate pyrophosphokinase
VLVAPYLGYMRQDRVFKEGEAISQQVVARLLGDAFDAVVTVEAHLHRIHALSEIFDCPAHSLSAAPAIARWCREAGREPLLVGPDAESEPWVRALAEATGLPWIVGEKTRLGDRKVVIELPDRLPSGGRGRVVPELALLVDDIASSGGTLAATAKALQARGTQRVEAVVVHALFAPGAEEVLRAAGLARLVSTDTLSHPSNAIGVAASIAAHLRNELGLGSQT